MPLAKGAFKMCLQVLGTSPLEKSGVTLLQCGLAAVLPHGGQTGTEARLAVSQV